MDSISMMKAYNDRFHSMMFPQSDQSIPKTRNYLETKDIQGAAPGSVQDRIKKINGRDYMNIRDIPGVKPNPNFIIYKSKHKDYKLDISDIEQKNKRVVNMTPSNVNSLEPTYTRLTHSRRHVQVLGIDENSKPKKFAPPKTRRKTNFIDDITGTKPKKSKGYSSKMLEKNNLSSFDYRKAQNNSKLNPITGEKYFIESPRPVPEIYNDRTNLSNKSRRLVRVLEKFGQPNTENGFRSRSRLQNDNSHRVLTESKPLREVTRNTIENVLSSRHGYIGKNNRENDPKNLLYNSKEYNDSKLPSLSKRMQTRLDKGDFKAYENDINNSLNTQALLANRSTSNKRYMEINPLPMSKRLMKPNISFHNKSFENDPAFVNKDLRTRNEHFQGSNFTLNQNASAIHDIRKNKPKARILMPDRNSGVSLKKVANSNKESMKAGINAKNIISKGLKSFTHSQNL